MNKINAKIVKETEKAILLKAFASYKNKGFEIEIWLPKTHVNKVADEFFELTDWAIKTKKIEIAEKFNGIAKRVKFASDYDSKLKPVWI
jgi:hypothetical protein